MRRRPTPGGVALAVLGVVTVVLLVLAVQKQASLSSAAAPVPPPAPAAPTETSRASIPVAFIGDGWTSGSPAGGRGPSNYTALLAARNAWSVTNVAVYGSGYAAGRTLAPQVAGIVNGGPRLVVVSAGRADLDADPDVVRDAAGRLYRDIRTRLPRAAVVVIGPIWLGDEPPPHMNEVRDAVRDAAAAERLPFVDPIADRWFVGRDRDGISAEGDLNDRGHRRLADLVDEELRRSNAPVR